MNSVVKTIALTIGMASLSAPAFATCNQQTDPNCGQVEVNLNTNVNIDPDTKGVFLQNNTGHVVGISTLKRVIITDGGELNVDTSAIGNSLNVNMTDSGPVEVRFVSQNNTGNIVARTLVTERNASDAATINLTTTAVANNLSLTTAGNSLAELGVTQCNTGNVLAKTHFYNDPKFFNVNTTAVGNNINIAGK